MTVSLRDTTVARPPALEVRGLCKSFGGRRGIFSGKGDTVHAVSDVDFAVQEGQTLGIVGESGCGKSTTARLILRLTVPDSGEVRVQGDLVSADDKATLKRLRGAIQMVFQDSYASLNPRLTVGETVMFGPRVQGRSAEEAADIADDILAKVGLDPARFADRFPHELSGGQRQRVNIARALSFAPSIVIMDEPVSALDKSVEAQVLNLLCDLRERLKLTYVFISHDLNVVRYIADHVLVMYLGKVVEVAPSNLAFSQPQHPYTRALVASAPSLNPDRRTTVAPMTGDLPSPLNPPSGCRFRTRCGFAEEICARVEPVLAGAGDHPSSLVACHMARAESGHSRGGRLDG
jgi:peptide/nickel transport system ATP-binding protein